MFPFLPSLIENHITSTSLMIRFGDLDAHQASKPTTISSKFQHWKWKKEGYLISTDPSTIPVATVHEIFASNDVYWAKSMPDDVMQETLQNSLCFGLYNTSSIPMPHNSSKGAPIDRSGPRVPSEFIGLARCVTDYTTFVCLTDVYILPGHQVVLESGWLGVCKRLLDRCRIWGGVCCLLVIGSVRFLSMRWF